MKIVICTTPIRRVPTDYPPLGSMAIIQSLQDAGYDPYFYDIDALRPSFEEVVEFFREQQPDLIGISAVVSTAYAYTKQLATSLKQAVPGATIIVGGNMAASAEILHRLAGIDLCVAGEGERVIVNIAKYVEANHGATDYAALQDIKGITYLDEHDHVHFTGYEVAIDKDDLFDPDYRVLERFSKIENFIQDPLSRNDFRLDPRSHEPHRAGMKMATVLTAKGCVARCTFCHRWDKGYRAFSAEKIVAQIKELKERYNVGFIQFGDENFGSDKRQIEELIDLMTPLDILYEVNGVRTRTVDLPLLKRLRESGCVAVYYGMETGSSKMLQIMEKNATLQNNIDAARWTYEAGIYTTYQLVLAMPGEDRETVAETIAFMKSITEFLPDPPTARMSINYIQALPGTPTYEYAKTKGMLGKTLQDEEKYLIRISDIDAADDTKFLNFTEYDYLTVQSWRMKLVLETMAHYYRRNAQNQKFPLTSRAFWRLLPKALLRAVGIKGSGNTKLREEVDTDMGYESGGYFNLQTHYLYRIFSKELYFLRNVAIWSRLLLRDLRVSGIAGFGRHVGEFMLRKVRKAPKFKEDDSLRKVMIQLAPAPETDSDVAMKPLRDGR